MKETGELCPEWGGKGIEFRGAGSGLQHKTCSRWKEPGHPTEAEIRAKFSEMFNAHYPASGRFA